MMAMEEEEGEGEVAALLHHYLNMVEVMIISLNQRLLVLNLNFLANWPFWSLKVSLCLNTYSTDCMFQQHLVFKPNELTLI